MTKRLFHRRGSAPCEAPLLYRGAGLDGIYLCNGFEREEIDGEWFTYIEDVEGLHRAIGLHLVEAHKELAPREIRFLRNAMDVTQADLARLLGVDTQTVARWEKGQTTMPGPADRYFRVRFLAAILPPEAFQEYVTEQSEKLAQLPGPTEEAVTFERDPRDYSWKESAEARVLEDA